MMHSEDGERGGYGVRVTPQELAQLKMSGERFGSLRNEDALRLIREISFLTEERDIARKRVGDAPLTDAAIADLFENNEKLRAELRDATAARDMLQKMYDGQDEEIKATGGCGTIHRDIFEAYIDHLVEISRAALGDG